MDAHLTLPTLDDGPLRPRDVGAKAARLSAARAAGLPVLPGVVVPARLGAATLERCCATLATQGSGAARLAAMDAELDPALVAALTQAARPLGRALVVRSSSELEDEATWAGAFTSYLDIAPEDLATAVRGVWASAFSRDALERCEQTGTAPERLALSVLVQPYLRAEAGGVASVAPDGTVEIVAVLGSPAGLLAGWDPGERASVDERGRLRGGGTVPEATLREVAELARTLHAALGDDHVEWGAADGTVHLLQAERRPAGEGTGPAITHPAGPAALQHPSCVAAVRLLRRFPGPLGEALVLPWALAATDLVPEPPQPVDDPAAAVRRAAALARQLTSQAWGLPPGRAQETARRTLSALRGADAAAAAERLAALRPVDRREARETLALLAGAGAAFAGAGALARADDVWWATAESAQAGQPDAAIRLGRAAQARPDAWEPLLHGVVTAAGDTVTGTGASDGAGAGMARVITDPEAPGQLRPREVIVADRPLPQLASLLWSAAGLVTRAGSPAAHLLEIARSLNVPAVTGCPLPDDVGTGGRDWLVAVDGERGAVALLEV